MPVPDFPPALADAVEGPAAAPASWVDPDSPPAAATKTVNGEALTLAFSDEFEEAGRDLGPGRDPKWETVHMHYVPTGDDEIYLPDGVEVSSWTWGQGHEGLPATDQGRKGNGRREARRKREGTRR